MIIKGNTIQIGIPTPENPAQTISKHIGEVMEVNKKRISKADKMFKELGYTKYDNHPEEDEPLKPNMFVTQDCRVIEYSSFGIINGHHCLQRISFETLNKRIVCEGFFDGRVIRAIPFSAKEIQAINEKVKELGWEE